MESVSKKVNFTVRELLFLSGGSVTGDVASVPATARGPPMPSPGEDCSWQISPPLPVEISKHVFEKFLHKIFYNFFFFYTTALTCQYF